MIIELHGLCDYNAAAWISTSRDPSRRISSIGTAGHVFCVYSQKETLEVPTNRSTEQSGRYQRRKP